jgi:hypothetical protein
MTATWNPEFQPWFVPLASYVLPAAVTPKWR